MNKQIIQIEYNRFLAPFFNFHTKQILKKDDSKWEPPSEEETIKNALKQSEAWKKVEKKTLDGLQGVTNLTFLENRIPVYIVPSRKGAFSDPIVMSSLLPPDRFIDLLTHELIHRLAVFNKQDFSFAEPLKKKFPDVDDKLVFNHIFVHAIHKYIYIDTFKNERGLERDMKNSQGSPAYKEAWEIVEEVGYKEIIKDVIG